MKKIYSFVSRALCLFLLAFFSLYSNGLKAQVQTARNISMTANSKGYYEYLPAGYASGTQSYPLIIFCHGIGELGNGGSDLVKVIDTGLPWLLNKGTFPTSFTTPASGTQSFIIISPQFINWPVPTDLNDILAYVLKNYRVNTNRIYITGLSMGGGATWAFAGNSAAYCDRIAAIVPIAGADAIDVTTAGVLANNGIGIWATQNNGDPTVPVSYTLNNVAQILAINPSAPVKETIFTASGHDAWTKTYDPTFTENGMNIYQWMLQYQRGTTVPVNQPPISNAGSDVTIVLPANSVQLNGNGSKDPDGTIASYSWTKISGPSQFTISNANIINPVVSNLVAGTYTLRLTVVDNKGASATDDINITVNNSSSGYENIPGKIEAESYSAMSGIETQSTSDAGGGLNIDYINNGDWMDYNLSAASTGNYTVGFRVASTYVGSQIQLKKSDGTILTTVTVPNTSGWQTWTTVTASVSLTSGNQTIRLQAIVPAGLPYGFNLNWLQFTAATTIVTPPPTSGYLPVPGKIEAEDYNAMNGVETQSTTDAGAGLNVDYINNGDWMDYNLSVSSTGNYSLGFRVAASAAGSQIQVKKTDGTVLTTINIPATGGWQTWTTVTANLALTSGNQTLRLQAIVPGTGFGFNLNWMQFASLGGSTSTSISGSPYIKVNVYGGSNPYSNSEWNNWNIGSQQVSNVSSGILKYADGTSSTALANLSSSIAVADNGTGYSGTLAPDEVLRYASYASGNRTLTLSGLSVSKKYDLELYASRGQNSGNSTLFIVNGTTQTIPTFDNLTQKASFTSLSSDAQGNITVSISQTSQYNYLNGFMLTENTNSTSSSSPEVVSSTITEESLGDLKESAQVYPNPVADMFVLKINNSYRGTVNIVIYNVNGSVMKEISAVKDQDNFLKNYNLGNNFKTGNYYIKLVMGTQSKTIKIVKL
jgi:Carbohydrate binding module (family 6)/Secretion system C-terminal sorting domain/PKD domain